MSESKAPRTDRFYAHRVIVVDAECIRREWKRCADHARELESDLAAAQARAEQAERELAAAIEAKERAEELAHQRAMGVQDTIALHAKEVSDLKAERDALAAKLAEAERDAGRLKKEIEECRQNR